jgi:hypothetical protein
MGVHHGPQALPAHRPLWTTGPPGASEGRRLKNIAS